MLTILIIVFNFFLNLKQWRIRKSDIFNFCFT